LQLGVAAILFLLGFQRHGLVLLVGVEGQVAVRFPGAVLVLLAAEDQPAVLGAFVVVEDHAGGLAVGVRIFLALDDDARRGGGIGDHQPQRAVGLAHVDAL